MICEICGTEVGCSCNMMTSNDGQKRGHTACILRYNQQLVIQGQQIHMMQVQAQQNIQNMRSALLTGPG